MSEPKQQKAKSGQGRSYRWDLVKVGLAPALVYPVFYLLRYILFMVCLGGGRIFIDCTHEIFGRAWANLG